MTTQTSATEGGPEAVFVLRIRRGVGEENMAALEELVAKDGLRIVLNGPEAKGAQQELTVAYPNNGRVYEVARRLAAYAPVDTVTYGNFTVARMPGLGFLEASKRRIWLRAAVERFDGTPQTTDPETLDELARYCTGATRSTNPYLKEQAERMLCALPPATRYVIPMLRRDPKSAEIATRILTQHLRRWPDAAMPVLQAQLAFNNTDQNRAIEGIIRRAEEAGFKYTPKGET